MCTHLPSNNNRHDDFTPTLRVTRNMSREPQDIRHNDSLLCSGRCSANALPKSDLLASGFTVEWSQQQELVLDGCVGSRDNYLSAD